MTGSHYLSALVLGVCCTDLYSSWFDIDYPLLLPDSLVNVSGLPILLGLTMIGNVFFLFLRSKLIVLF